MYFFCFHVNNLVMAIMLIRTIIIYLLVLMVIRLMGKRQIGEMQPFEFVITLIIADLACIPMAELSVPLIHGVVPILIILVLHFFICVLARKFMFARYLLTGKPVIVISPNGINYQELKELNMTLDDLLELLRGCDVVSLSDVAYAIIETNGNLSVIKKSQTEPVTREDMKIETQQNTLPINLIMDGKLMKDNIKIAQVNESLIKECLEKGNIKNIKNVLILTLDANGEVFLQDKTAESCLSFTIDYDGGGKW